MPAFWIARLLNSFYRRKKKENCALLPQSSGLLFAFACLVCILIRTNNNAVWRDKSRKNFKHEYPTLDRQITWLERTQIFSVVLLSSAPTRLLESTSARQKIVKYFSGNLLKTLSKFSDSRRRVSSRVRYLISSFGSCVVCTIIKQILKG